MAAMQMPHDPVLEALGLSSAATSNQDWMSWQQATPYDYTMTDPNQAAWCQAQAMITTAWQLQQMASWTAQAAAYSAAYTVPLAPVATTPRTIPAAASEDTPTKMSPLSSDKSTEPGSPGGETDVSEQEQSENEGVVDAFALPPPPPPATPTVLDLSSTMPPPPPPPTPTKLDLNAIIFERAKDPASIHLLQLLKGSQNAETHGQEKGRELLGLLRENEPVKEKRNGPLASGSHRRAAVAARAAVDAAAAELEAEETTEYVGRRRRPRGGRGCRGGRAK